MKKLCLTTLAALLLTASAFAQSSGNFSATIAKTQCAIDSNGILTGGLTQTSLSSTVQTPNSSQTALLIRPSLVTGLFTDTNLSSGGGSNKSTANAAVNVKVTIDGNPVAPATTTNPSIVFDQRFQALSSNILSQITCVANSTTVPCFIDLLLSTLSAHSFDFVAPSVGGGSHLLKVEWTLDMSGTNGGTAAACVGPGVITVQQVKNFSQSQPITIGP